MIRFGVSAPNAGPPADLVRLAAETEAAGWDGWFCWDHVQFIRDAGLPLVDPWVVLGAAATATERVRLGPLVTPLPRRRAEKVAKEVVTLDHLSGGRAVLGVGIGWPDGEFEHFGAAADARRRAEVLDESLTVLDGLWSGERFSFAGRHLRIDEAELRPPPVQRPRPPVWVATMWPNRRPLRRAARCEGVVAINTDGTMLRPEALAQLVAEARALGAPADWEVVLSPDPDVPWPEYADAGATWLLCSTWPEGDWFAGLRSAVRKGPPQ